MRFAGQRVSDFTGGVAGVEDYMADSPNYGETAQAAGNIARKKLTNSMDQQSQTMNAGILGAADTEAASIVGAAQSSLANAQGQASIMSGIGSIGGSIIGGLNIGNIGTNRGKSLYSQPHASGVGREALGGYDI